MKVLLTDASSLTSRQLSTILSRAGHKVHLFSPSFSLLTRFTSHVTAHHAVPAFGNDPYAWLEAALSIIISAKLNGQQFDVLICSQEQVAVVSAETSRVKETGIHVAAPEFGSLRRVMDKISAVATFKEAGLSQPESVVLSSLDLKSSPSSIPSSIFPAYAKTPNATGSTGVRRVSTISDLEDVVQEWVPFERGGRLLLHKEVQGPLLMICGIFSHGTLIAWHACLRAREGINGGASVKISYPLPIVEAELRKLGHGLKWHGGMSADVILLEKKEAGGGGGDGEKELVFIDINPRIVEPMNGLLAGVDLVRALMEVSLEGSGFERVDKYPRAGKEGVQTHQLILVLLAAAKEGRVAFVMELWMALRGCDGCYGYRGSVEELTPIEKDWRSIIVLVGLSLLLFVGGKWMVEKLSGETIKNYALSSKGWEEICKREDEKAS